MIDPNEAPKGYRAAEKLRSTNGPCFGCDLIKDPSCLDAHCTPGRRVDGCAVILKRIGPVMATVPLNYGSMGEEVA